MYWRQKSDWASLLAIHPRSSCQRGQASSAKNRREHPNHVMSDSSDWPKAMVACRPRCPSAHSDQLCLASDSTPVKGLLRQSPHLLDLRNSQKRTNACVFLDTLNQPRHILGRESIQIFIEYIQLTELRVRKTIENRAQSRERNHAEGEVS